MNIRSMSADKAKRVRYIRDMSREMAKMANRTHSRPREFSAKLGAL
jgi:hypothetical protein